MSTSSDRTSEIWSTRLQRELLTLTTKNTHTHTLGIPADTETKTKTNIQTTQEETETKTETESRLASTTGSETEEAESLEKNSNSSPNTLSNLPPFLQFVKHDLQLGKGICQVTFQLTLTEEDLHKTMIVTTDSPVAITTNSTETDTNTTDTTDTTDTTNTHTDTDTTITANTTNTHTDTLAVEPTTQDQMSMQPIHTFTQTQVSILFLLDASLHFHPTNHPSKNIDAASTYPFQKPNAFLVTGDQYFPAGSKIQIGDEIDIDCDWTPSLHLTDAALHVALKIRESIKRSEPFFPAVKMVPTTPTRLSEPLDKKNPFKRTILGDISTTTVATTTKISSFFSSLKSKAAELGTDLDQAVGANVSATFSSSSSPPSSPSSSLPEESKPNLKPSPQQLSSPSVETSTIPQQPEQIPREDSSIIVPSSSSSSSTTPSLSSVTSGSIIDLSGEPWCSYCGMYAVKNLRRPDFIETVVASANATSGKTTKVASAGLAGVGYMFKSFTQSAKTLVEESFLMLTNDFIVELKCNKFSIANATVVFAVPVSFLSRLKFRRQESISLFFKDAPEDPLIYMCTESAEVVKQLQSILKSHGVKGKHTNSAMTRSIQLALEIIAEIQVREKEVEEQPSLEKVQLIMDLYRQAAEKFEFADDPRHGEVMNLLHRFLAKPLTASILDGSYMAKMKANPASGGLESPSVTPPEGIILESPRYGDSEDDTDVEHVSTRVHEKSVSDDEFQKSMKEAEEMLRMAHSDLKDLGIDDEELEGLKDTSSRERSHGSYGQNTDGGSLSIDNMSELEDMLKNVDKELEDLIK